MINAKELYNYLDSFAPFDTAMDFDNVGILTGDPEKPSDKVVVALDATAGVIREASEKKAGIIVTHHPVIFRPVRTILSDSIPYLAAQNGLTILSAHTNLDIAKGGVNELLAENACLITDEVYPENCLLIGHLPKWYDCRTYAAILKESLGLNGLRYTDTAEYICRVAVACGAGGDNVYRAHELKADAIVTGEIKHHEIVYANDHGISVFDIGHFNSENMIVRSLADKLSIQFPHTEFIVSDSSTDHTFYLGEN